MLQRQLLLPTDGYAPALARRRLQKIFGALPPSVLDDLLLLVTEVVTNSIRHAGLRPDDQVRVTVRVLEHSVRVEVTDPGRGEPFGPRRAKPTDTSGRGLMLVAMLADRWGADRSHATSVWFELDLASSRERVG